MENIRKFFSEIEDNAIDKINLVKSGKYRVITSKSDIITCYRNKIAEKIFSLNDDDRKIYARLLLKEINGANPVDRIVQYEDEINDKEYLLKKITNEHGKSELVDVSVLIDDCKLFIAIISELFLDFKIDLRDTAKELIDLGYELLDDYSLFVFLDEDIIAKLKRKNEEKKIYKKMSDFTAERQFLTIETMLSELGVVVKKKGRRSEGQFDKIAFASFLQFLTGREADSKPKDTRFYKMINNEERLDRANYNDDCDFIAYHFKKLGLNELSDKLQRGKES